MKKQDFIYYVLSFYGPGGIYDYKFSLDEVEQATEQYIAKPGTKFEGDSLDRELVRDIVFANRGETV